MKYNHKGHVHYVEIETVICHAYKVTIRAYLILQQFSIHVEFGSRGKRGGGEGVGKAAEAAAGKS